MTEPTILQSLLNTLRMRENQEFNLVYKGGATDGTALAGNPYKFTSTELLDRDGTSATDDIVSGIVFGSIVIEDAAYYPKKGDKYYTIAFSNVADFRVQEFTFQSSQTDVLRSSKGMCYKTKLEADTAMPLIKAELETYF